MLSLEFNPRSSLRLRDFLTQIFLTCTLVRFIIMSVLVDYKPNIILVPQGTQFLVILYP